MVGVDYDMTPNETQKTLQSVLVYILTGLLTVTGWFLTSTLSKIDQNQTRLADSVNQLSSQVSFLQGRYEVLERLIKE